MNALVTGNGSYIVRPCGHDLHGPTCPFLRQFWASIGLCLNLPNLPLIVQIPWKAYEKHGTSLYCETGAPLVAIWMTLTLEPIKSLCTISTMRLVFLGLMVSLSHLQRLCHSIFRRVLEYNTLWTGNLWHFGRMFSWKAFAFWMFREIGFPPRTLLEFQTRIFKAWNRAILDVCGSLSDSSELPLVTPLAFLRSSSCSSGRVIAHGRVFRCWSPLNLDIALEFVCCYCLLLVE